MSYNKVVYGATTLVDLTNDTVTATSLLSGVTAHSKAGDAITGSLVIQKYYTGLEEPTSDIGSDGDIYLVTES